METINMTGKRYGSVTALHPDEKHSGGKIKWVCRCDCGRDFTACGGKIRSGEVITCQSCSKERVRLSRVSHGKSKTAEDRIWTHIKSRCFNPKVPCYKHYGGRGITMCDRWKNSLENFISDMGFRPSANHSIDRIDNNGNYEPGNCRWATQKVQTNNTRANRKVTIEGDTRNMSQWADEIGVSRELVFKRLKRGITGAALLNPSQTTDKFTFAGTTASIPEWSLRTGIKRATLYWRINKKNWPLEKALTTGVTS